MNIRNTTNSDLDKIIILCEKHAEFEKAEYNAENKKEALQHYLFNSSLGLQCLVIEIDDNICGYATYLKQFSTWDTSLYIYLDCLFIEEEYRGFGFGKKIMEKVKDYAESENCKTIQWQTPDFNINAIKFYHKIGATSKSRERFTWRL